MACVQGHQRNLSPSFAWCEAGGDVQKHDGQLTLPSESAKSCGERACCRWLLGCCCFCNLFPLTCMAADKCLQETIVALMSLSWCRLNGQISHSSWTTRVWRAPVGCCQVQPGGSRTAFLPSLHGFGLVFECICGWRQQCTSQATKMSFSIPFSSFQAVGCAHATD